MALAPGVILVILALGRREKGHGRDGRCWQMGPTTLLKGPTLI